MKKNTVALYYSHSANELNTTDIILENSNSLYDRTKLLGRCSVSY